MKILVTGGAGYIGSHTCVELLQAGHDLIVLDNLSNSSEVALQRVSELTGKKAPLIVGDIRDATCLDALFSAHTFDAVIHFAGLKAVGESNAQPVRYYDHNVNGTLTLLRAMAEHEVFTMVFSSSATVYGDPEIVPIREDASLGPTNPYGRSKLMVEQVLTDLQRSDERWSITLLRYFNPVGAHISGRIGEDPHGIPNNLMPYIAQVAVGKLERLSIFGSDYPTPDGTGVRDYIHVVDLALGHLAALNRHLGDPGCHIYNLGTGRGVSVLEMRAAFEVASGQPIPFVFTERRPGDIAECWADPSHAQEQLAWYAQRGLDEMVSSSWRWQSHNPKGYSEPVK